MTLEKLLYNDLDIKITYDLSATLERDNKQPVRRIKHDETIWKNKDNNGSIYQFNTQF